MKKMIFLSFLANSFFLFAQENVTVQSAKDYQDNLNKEFSNREESPLTDEDLKVFNGLSFYPINEKFTVKAKFTRTENEKVFEMKTSTSRLPKYLKYGELLFTINERQFKLNVYQNMDLVDKPEYKDYLFLPFSDLTCGKESYIGGRYVDMRIKQDSIWTIDFNKAYNPYCAYSHKFSCPIVPLENDLDIEIFAGVKKFHD